MKFKVGDIVRCMKKGIYSVTDYYVECKVTAVPIVKSRMKVTPSHTTGSFEVETVYFELVKKRNWKEVIER